MNGMAQDDHAFDFIGKKLFNVSALDFLLVISHKHEKFVAIDLIGGKKLIQHLGIIVQIQIGDNNADKFSLAVGQDSSHLVFFIV